MSGWVLFNLAAFGTDQDLVQRMLTCRSSRSAGWSVILSALIGLPVTALFLVIGLFLFGRDQLPGGPGFGGDDSRTVFLSFILQEVPAGLRGLIIAGLFAAAMSTLASGLNSMASTAISDFYVPWRLASGRGRDDAAERRVSRAVVLGWAVVLGGFAAGCVAWQTASGLTLIEFALGVMIYAYSGMLAVFLAALLTKRGNGASALAALVTGAVSVILLQMIRFDGRSLAIPWLMTASTALAFAVCCAGRRPRSGPVVPADREQASHAARASVLIEIRCPTGIGTPERTQEQEV
jgi:Na+/proline symporter